MRGAFGTMAVLFAWMVTTSAASAATVPGPPGKLVATVKGASLTLKWSPPTSGAAPTGYRLEAGSRPGASDFGTFDVGPVTSIGPVPVPPLMLYIRVRARNGAGVGAPSNEVLVSVACQVPPPPGGPEVTVTNVNQVTLRWLAPITPPAAAPTGYMLSVGVTDFGNELGTYDMGNRTSLGPVAFPPGAYNLTLSSYNACGPSAVKISVGVKVGSPPVSNPRWTVIESFCCSSGDMSLTAQVDGRTLQSTNDACGDRPPVPSFPGYVETTPGPKVVQFQQRTTSDASCSYYGYSGSIPVQFNPQSCYWVVQCGQQGVCPDVVRVTEHPLCELPTTWDVVDDGCPSLGCGGF